MAAFRLTRRESVLAAMAEFDQLGRDALSEKYGFRWCGHSNERTSLNE